MRRQELISWAYQLVVVGKRGYCENGRFRVETVERCTEEETFFFPSCACARGRSVHGVVKRRAPRARHVRGVRGHPPLDGDVCVYSVCVPVLPTLVRALLQDETRSRMQVVIDDP